jgi:ornithine cyclodeaminase
MDWRRELQNALDSRHEDSYLLRSRYPPFDETMHPIYIGKDDVARALSMESCISLMREALSALSSGRAIQPLRSILWLPDKTGGMGLMPAWAADPKRLGIKVISVFPENRKAGLSSHQGFVLLFESENGKPLAIVDADEITAIRTAAASGLATKLLSRDIPSTLAILGSGIQAWRHVESMLSVRKINSVRVWSRTSANAEELAGHIARKHKIPADAFENSKDAVLGADIICTTTASPTPVVLGEWIKEGAHINAVGSCIPRAREFDTEAIRKSKLYTDRYESLFQEAGDFIIPKNEGAITDDHVRGELGEVILGSKRGRESDIEITMFKSLGIGIEDVYAADYVYKSVTGQTG